MGDAVKYLGEAKVSGSNHISIIKEARPWLDNPQAGEYIEFFVENEELIIRKKKVEK